jgi:signal transduction histidine kinase
MDSEGRLSRDELVRELFHELNQPLSSLSCGLELALESQKNVASSPLAYREVLIQSLTQTQRATALAGDLQALSCSMADNDTEIIDMNECLQEAFTDFLPVAKAAGVMLSLSSASCKVRWAFQPLRQTLFRLLEHVLAGPEPGQTIPVVLEAVRDNARVTIRWVSADPSSGARKSQLRLAVIRELLLTRESTLEEHFAGREHSLVLVSALANHKSDLP